MGRTRRIRFRMLPEGSSWFGSDSEDSDADNDSSGDAPNGSAVGGSRASASPAGTGAAPAAAAPRRRGPVKYLAYFANSLLDFRIPEFEALAQMAGAGPGEVVWEPPRGGDPESPFRFVTLPSRAVARRVAERAVLLRSLIEVWAEGPDWPSVQKAFEALPAARTARHLGPDTTFRIKIDTWGFKWAPERKREVLEALEFVSFEGKVDLSPAAGVHFWAILVGAAPGHPGGAAGAAADAATAREEQQQQQEEEAGSGGEGEQQQRRQGGSFSERDPWCWIYFGREVALAASRALPSAFTLKERRYLGPTSMDAEMAFVMANMAWARPGSIAFDPYCGTGSVLLAAARFGSTVLGGDIDMRVIKLGKRNQKTGAQEDNFSNYEQYGLPWPAGLLRMDASRPPWRPGLEGVFDCILGDPPYGVRAGGRKSHPKEGVQVWDPSAHFASTAPYGLTECVDDLVGGAARMLRTGGRLVFFIPVSRETPYDASELPAHPAMELAANCEQPLSTRYSRRLIVYSKARDYDAAAAAAWREARRGFVMSIERVADLVWEPKPEKAARGAEASSATGDAPRERRQRDAEAEAARVLVGAAKV